MLMIVDDNSLMRRLLRCILSPVAARFCECADGGEAVEMYRVKQPDWVLLDVEMDGLALTRRLLAEFPAARVAILAVYDDDRLRAAALDAGARGFASKEDLVGLPALLGCGQNQSQQQPLFFERSLS